MTISADKWYTNFILMAYVSCYDTNASGKLFALWVISITLYMLGYYQ